MFSVEFPKGSSLKGRETDIRKTPMNMLEYLRFCVLLFCLAVMFWPQHGAAQQNSGASSTTQEPARDGQHDFDWDIGTWKIHVRRLQRPLTGSTTWVEYDGTDVVRKFWEGANQGVVEWNSPAGHLEIFTLRLYNAEAHQWNIYFANSAGGPLSQPVVGEFKNGRGEFYDQEPYNGRTILVRFAVSDITPNSCRFEQAFSADGAKTWEVNLVVTETLVKDAT